MRIWFAANIRSDSHGGVARSMHELAAGLAARGHQIEVIDNGGPRERGYLIFALVLAGRLVFAGSRAPVWIIARSTDGVFCALVSRLLRLRTRVILHNHGWEEEVAEIEQCLPWRVTQGRTSWKARAVRFPLLRLALRYSTLCMSGTVCGTRWVALRYPAQRRKQRYLSNGVALRAEPLRQYEKARPDFLFVGNLSWKKNAHYALAVYSHLRKAMPEATLTCVGTQVDADSPGRLADVDTSGVASVPDAIPGDMGAWYESCPFLIAPSRYEGGHAFTILEAMSHGCIVFVSAIPSNREIVRDGMNGFLLAGVHAEEDARRIVGLLQQSDTCAGIRVAAARTAGHFVWQRQIDRLEKMLCL